MAETDEQQVEAIKKWFAEYGRYIVLGLVIGLGGVMAWRGWEAHQLGQAQDAASRYAALLEANEAGDLAAAETTAQALRDAQPGSPYTVHAALALAETKLAEKDTAAARRLLEAVLDARGDSSLTHVVRLRLARIELFYGNDPDAALQRLDINDAGEFAPLYAELRGDALLAQDKRREARAEYQIAIDSWVSDLGSRRGLQLKLDDLRDVAEAEEPAEAEAVDAGEESGADAASATTNTEAG